MSFLTNSSNGSLGNIGGGNFSPSMIHNKKSPDILELSISLANGITLIATAILATMGKISPQTAGCAYIIEGALALRAVDKSKIGFPASTCSMGLFVLNGTVVVTSSGYALLVISLVMTVMDFLRTDPALEQRSKQINEWLRDD